MVGAGILGCFLAVATAPRVAGAAATAVDAARWLLAFCALPLVVGLIVGFAPAEHPQVRWASAGSLLIVASWVVATPLFREWIVHVASFRSPTGALLGVLLLTGYLFVGSIVFLVGVQLDELLRKRTDGRARSLLQLVRGA